MQTFLNVLLVILVIAVIALAVLYFLGRKLEKRQVEQQQLLEMSKQTVSMLVIDKKKMKIKDSGLPKIVALGKGSGCKGEGRSKGYDPDGRRACICITPG